MIRLKNPIRLSNSKLLFGMGLASLAILFLITSFLVYGHYRSTLIEAQQANQLKISQTVAQSLALYFDKLEYITEETVNTRAFRPELSQKEDRLRFQRLSAQQANQTFSKYKLNSVLESPTSVAYRSDKGSIGSVENWQLFRGLPVADDQGRPVAEARREKARTILKTFKDLHYAFEMDANGNLVFLEPFQVQKNVTSFNYDFRDYLQLVRKNKQTVISEGYISHDLELTETITVASPIFDRAGKLVKLFAVSVSAKTLRERVFQTLRNSMHLIDDTTFYFVDRHGHIVASSSGLNTYKPVMGNGDDSRDEGNVRDIGFFRQMKWKPEQLEKGNIWSRATRSWTPDLLNPKYFGEYKNMNGEVVFGTFVPTSLFPGQQPTIGILVETPIAKFKGAEQRLTRIFLMAGISLALILSGIAYFILATFNRLYRELLDTERQITQVQKDVSHNLRSPLTALESVLDQLQVLPEGIRVTVRTAIVRIRDITNTLISSKAGPAESRPDFDRMETVLIAPLIDSLVSEKRMEYQSRNHFEISFQVDSCSYGLFAKVDPVEFKCMLSNLMNNSIESLEGGGKVEIRISKGNHRIQVEVQDNGQGIPADILHKLNESPFSHNKPQGQGLGLLHAKTHAANWGGSFFVTSIAGQGTTAHIHIPMASPPEWFVSSLKIGDVEQLVILDDDSSIHSIWDSRLKEFSEGAKIKVVHCTNETQFRKFIQSSGPGFALSTLFLVDYELLGGEHTGLDLIEEFKLGPRSVLVTSRWEEKCVIARCGASGVKILPKSMAPLIPLVSRPLLKGIDCVLIDDDPLVEFTWKQMGLRLDKKIAYFSNAESFLEVQNSFPETIPIFIDSNLQGEVRGEEVARVIYENGHRDISLVTGYSPDHFGDLPWVKEIRSKEPPWKSP